MLARPEGWRDAVKQEFLDIDSAGLEATLLGAIFGVGHNSNADLSSRRRARERARRDVRWTRNVRGGYHRDG